MRGGFCRVLALVGAFACLVARPGPVRAQATDRPCDLSESSARMVDDLRQRAFDGGHEAAYSELLRMVGRFCADGVVTAEEQAELRRAIDALVRRIEPARSATESRQPPDRWRWYGWHILFIDVPSLSLGVALETGMGDTVDEDAMARLWAFGVVLPYLLGGPIVHLAHGEGGVGFFDLIVRGLFGALSAYLGSQMVEDAAGWGFLFGGAVASALDVAAIAWEEND